MGTSLGINGTPTTSLAATTILGNSVICISGVWKEIAEVYICIAGVWKSLDEVDICISSAWKTTA